MPQPDERRLKRCYHRVISGMERGGSLRLITLTSSNISVKPIQHDFRCLIWRLRRRGLLQDYIRVIEVKDDGREHIHMCFRGNFIAQQFLSYLWNELHQSPVVDIRRVKPGKKNKKGVAGYLAKYMAKEVVRRYSWSWNWVYKGFVAVWIKAKRFYNYINLYRSKPIPFYDFLKLWKIHLKALSPPDQFLGLLELNLKKQMALRRDAWTKSNTAA